MDTGILTLLKAIDFLCVSYLSLFRSCYDLMRLCRDLYFLTRDMFQEISTIGSKES